MGRARRQHSHPGTTVQPAAGRSLDAIHLATAMRMRSRLTSFVTYDKRLADAAHVAGLTVGMPAWYRLIRTPLGAVGLEILRFQRQSDRGRRPLLPHHQGHSGHRHRARDQRRRRRRGLSPRTEAAVRLRDAKEFDFAASSKRPAARIRDLAALRWLHAGESVILFGPAGVGETHIAQALGHLAVRQGAHVRFAKTSRILAELAGGHADRRPGRNAFGCWVGDADFVGWCRVSRRDSQAEELALAVGYSPGLEVFR